eukprot:13755-Chlamydomonas_euryale.AAC.1
MQVQLERHLRKLGQRCSDDIDRCLVVHVIPHAVGRKDAADAGQVWAGVSAGVGRQYTMQHAGGRVPCSLLGGSASRSPCSMLGVMGSSTPCSMLGVMGSSTLCSMLGVMGSSTPCTGSHGQQHTMQHAGSHGQQHNVQHARSDGDLPGRNKPQTSFEPQQTSFEPQQTLPLGLHEAPSPPLPTSTLARLLHRSNTPGCVQPRLLPPAPPQPFVPASPGRVHPPSPPACASRALRSRLTRPCSTPSPTCLRLLSPSFPPHPAVFYPVRYSPAPPKPFVPACRQQASAFLPRPRLPSLSAAPYATPLQNPACTPSLVTASPPPTFAALPPVSARGSSSVLSTSGWLAMRWRALKSASPRPREHAHTCAHAREQGGGGALAMRWRGSELASPREHGTPARESR